MWGRLDPICKPLLYSFLHPTVSHQPFLMLVLQARIMNGQGTSIIGAFRDVITQQGPLALYRGLPAQVGGDLLLLGQMGRD